MTKLLVSVRNVDEAVTALQCGVHLIDVKEPKRGALGAADASTLAGVVAEVGMRTPTSAALGELVDWTETIGRVPSTLKFAKFGLAGCRQKSNWTEIWQEATVRLPNSVAPIAVAYADWECADSPDPWSILSLANRLRPRGLLLDTFDKQRGSLLDHFNLGELSEWIASLKEAGLVSVVAGGLNVTEVGQVASLEPDFVGVRGAACGGDRCGEIESTRVELLLETLRATPHGFHSADNTMNSL